MKKTIAFLLLAVVMTILLISCQKPAHAAEPSEPFYLEAIVIEVNGNALLVAPVEGSRETSDQIWVVSPQEGGEEYLPNAAPGDKVKVAYDGLLAETYPPQIISPYSIELISTGNEVPDVTRP